MREIFKNTQRGLKMSATTKYSRSQSPPGQVYSFNQNFTKQKQLNSQRSSLCNALNAAAETGRQWGESKYGEFRQSLKNLGIDYSAGEFTIAVETMKVSLEINLPPSGASMMTGDKATKEELLGLTVKDINNTIRAIVEEEEENLTAEREKKQLIDYLNLRPPVKLYLVKTRFSNHWLCKLQF